jgi:hypothetical protein
MKRRTVFVCVRSFIVIIIDYTSFFARAFSLALSAMTIFADLRLLTGLGEDGELRGGSLFATTGHVT